MKFDLEGVYSLKIIWLLEKMKMKSKTIFACIFLLISFLSQSCEGEVATKYTNTPVYITVEAKETPSPFALSSLETTLAEPSRKSEDIDTRECHPAAERIEMDRSYNKGVGCGYTDIDYGCAIYCIWVPEGSQLKIRISDSFSDLVLIVQRDLFDDKDSEERWESDVVGRYQNEMVMIENPEGRYYIQVCPKTGADCMFSNNTVVFTSAAFFTLESEWLP